MVCAQCGATCDEGQRFCYNCGSRLDSPQQPAAPQGVYQQPPVAVEAPQQAVGLPLPPAPLQPSGYEATPGQYMPQAIPNSTMAIISLVAGILSWVVLPLIGAIAAVITGHMARREIRASAGQLSGDGLALIGLILGYANLVITALGICFIMFFLVIAASGT